MVYMATVVESAFIPPWGALAMLTYVYTWAPSIYPVTF